jgi:hypothetical protein
MSLVGGSTYSYDWDTSSIANVVYNVTIVASDNAGNKRRLLTYVVVDLIQPTATLNIPVGGGYATVNSQGNVLITGTITDNPSVGGRQSGIDENSVFLRIQAGSTTVTIDNTGIGFIPASGSYSYDWTIFFTTNQTRDLLFTAPDTWDIILSYDDMAGNNGSTQQSVTLDNIIPSVLISTPPLASIVNDTVEMGITLSDSETGLDISTLQVDVVNTFSSQIVLSFIDPDLNIIDLGNGNYNISFNISSVPNDVYVFNATVFDRTGNIGFDSFLSRVDLPIPTIPTNTTTTGPPGGPLLGPVDLISFILFDLVALGVGVGMAVIYERLKVMRRGG